MVGGKPTQDNSLRNYRHQLSWLSLERRNLLTEMFIHRIFTYQYQPLKNIHFIVP